MSKPRRKIIIDDDEREMLEEQSLRERMDAAEKDRVKRQEERKQRKKDRRNRVEKMFDRPISKEEKLEKYKKEVLDELEKREKLFEERILQMENKLTSATTQQNKELEDNLVNNFIRRITFENYSKLDDRLNTLTTSLTERIEDLSKKKNRTEAEDSKKIKSMMVGMQNKIKEMEEDLKNKKDIEEEEETESEDGQYELLQSQLNDITLLLAKKDKANAEIDVIDLETKIGRIVNDKIDEKIDMKLSQDNRMNDMMEKIADLENISTNIKKEIKDGEKDKSKFDLILGNVIDQLKDNNDKKMERMYKELKKKINRIEKIDDDKVSIKETMIKDMERRLYEIEVYKKKIERNEDRRKSKAEKEILKKERRKRKYDNKKNWILKKHNLLSDDIKLDNINKNNGKISLTKKITDEDIKIDGNPYMKLYNTLKSRIPSKWLTPFNDKQTTNLYKELASRYERNRNGAFKKMKLKKNELTNKYSMKKAYGAKRGVVILDNREGERVKIYKKYGCEIKERFLNKATIYMQYMHNFSFCLKNKENGDVLNIYYNETEKPSMVYIEYKSKTRGKKLYKYKKKMVIGEKIEIKINSYEDSRGEHLRVRFGGFDIEVDNMIRIMSISGNIYFEIYVEEFDDDALFDI